MAKKNFTPENILNGLDAATPVLIAGCTASGKSELALQIAERQGGVIVNADAMQVYSNWSVLTARPQADDLARADHRLYGHVAGNVAYTVGDWLRDVAPLLRGARPIIVGGTGLFFRALTEGLVDIPSTPSTVRFQADDMPLHDLIADLDQATQAAIDLNNRARVQRAWEVQAATGRSILDWQAETPPPLLPLDQTQPLLLQTDVDWLNTRIARRFDLMVEGGALEEARANLPTWDPAHLSARAIGAPELIAYVTGKMDLGTAKERSVIATRQYAKRQRTWFRKRMGDWTNIQIPAA